MTKKSMTNSKKQTQTTSQHIEKQIVDISPKKGWKHRVIIFTPTTGLVRMEWVLGRYGQIIPTNWSNIDLSQFMYSYIPIDYQLADAQNLMAKKVVEYDTEWVLFLEHDNVLEQSAFAKINQYMLKGNIPVVSGIYFTKSMPPEPILYRGRGTGYFGKWKLGDKVWVDGVPFGFTLCHGSIIRAAWNESEEYMVGGEKTRRVFMHPQKMWYDKGKGAYMATSGTTDLEWCTRIMRDKLFEKAGFPKFQKMKHPFLVDTNIFVWHIDELGKKHPLYIPKEFQPPKNYKGKVIK
jgi:hypothetical protein